MAYSTIRQKVGDCEVCGKRGPLTKKQCQSCYWTGIKLKSVKKQEEKEGNPEEEATFPELVKELDEIVSKYVRLSAADKDGICQCYTCPTKEHYSRVDAGHFVGRSCMWLRWDTGRNIRVQCQKCNRMEYGKALVFAVNLDKELPGVTDYLMEESRKVHKWSDYEIRQMIKDFRIKVKQLNK